MSCCEKCGAEPCEFKPSAILGGQYWPRSKRAPWKTISEGSIQPFHILSDVKQNVFFTVRDGLMLVWFQPEKPDITEGCDFEVAVDPHPFICPLGPGEHTIWIGASTDADVDLICRVSAMDAEKHS